MAKTTKRTTGSATPLTPDQVVREFAPLVYKIAHGLSRRTVDPVDDLIQVGMIGLLEAQRRFDVNQAASFKTYATHFITGHIRHYLRDKQQLLKGPRSLQELSYRVQTTEKRLKQELRRDPSEQEVADELAVDLASVQEVYTYLQRVRMLWLDQTYNDGQSETRTLLDTLPDDEGSLQSQLDTRIYIDEGLRRLPELDQQLLRLRYFGDMTQAAIAEDLGMSQMDVCRKLKQAEKRLRQVLHERVF